VAVGLLAIVRGTIGIGVPEPAAELVVMEHPPQRRKPVRDERCASGPPQKDTDAPAVEVCQRQHLDVVLLTLDVCAS
jgi:hypothetical protein